MNLGIFTSRSCSDGKEKSKKEWYTWKLALLFSKSKPVAFLRFSLPPPSSLLKLPIWKPEDPRNKAESARRHFIPSNYSCQIIAIHISLAYVAGAWSNGRKKERGARGGHARGKIFVGLSGRRSLSPRMVFLAYYFQAPASQANISF